MSTPSILRPLYGTPAQIFRSLFAKVGQYRLDQTRGILTKNGEKLRFGQTSFTSHVQKGKRWFVVIKIERGPLLSVSEGKCEETAKKEAKELASQLGTGHSEKGQRYLLDTHSKLRALKGYGSLASVHVVSGNWSLTIETETPRGRAWAELMTDSSRRLCLYNGVGQKQVLCRLSAIKRLSTEFYKGKDTAEFRVSFHGVVGTILTLSTILKRTLVRTEDFDKTGYRSVKSCYKFDTEAQEAGVLRVRRLLRLTQPAGKTPKILRDDILRRLEGR